MRTIKEPEILTERWLVSIILEDIARLRIKPIYKVGAALWRAILMCSGDRPVGGEFGYCDMAQFCIDFSIDINEMRCV